MCTTLRALDLINKKVIYQTRSRVHQYQKEYEIPLYRQNQILSHFQDAGTTNTIQEILTNLQGQQLAQASFSTVHLYIFGYLLIGVVIGTLVYVIIQKKKKNSRQSVRITQPHRFAVPSRPQRSSYP